MCAPLCVPADGRMNALKWVSSCSHAVPLLISLTLSGFTGMRRRKWATHRKYVFIISDRTTVWSHSGRS